MARIAGVNIPLNKRVEVGLTYIFGVGDSQSRMALAATGIEKDTYVRDLTEDEVRKLRDYIDNNLTVEGDLIIEDLPRLTAIETTAVLVRIAGCLIAEDNPLLSARDLEPLVAAADCVTRDSPRSRWRGR